jgi:O-antigen ligase
VIGIVLALAALFSVLALGGVEAFGFAPAQIAVVLLATVIFWQRGFPRASGLTRALLAALLAFPALQLVPLPRAWVEAVLPQRAALTEALLVPIGALEPSQTLSLSPYETKLALLRLACYLLVFLLAFVAQRSRREVLGLATALLGIGVLLAAYGCIQFLIGQQYIFEYRRWIPAYNATGTFVNRNHFAGLLEMIVPFLLAQVLFARWAAGSSRRSPWVNLIVSPLSSRLLLRIVLLALLCIALIFSRSRMGLMAGIGGMLVVGAIVFLQKRQRSVLLAMALVLAIPMAYSLWIGISPVVQRFERLTQEGYLETDRLPVWRDTLTLIGDYPLTGTGLGTYRWTNQHYQTSRFSGTYEHAHNDYLEFASEIGIPAAALLFGSLWVLVIRTARCALSLESVRDRTLAAGCAGAMAAILIHGITDFNLQIPSNALIFAWIAGTAAALVRNPDRPEPLAGQVEVLSG